MIAVETIQTCDAYLVAQSLTGDSEAFGQIVARYQTLICSLAFSRLGNLSQSEDVAQETFIAAWKQLAQLREPHKLRSWLCSIARNIIYDAVKAQGREPSHAAETLDEVGEAAALDELPPAVTISNEESAILWRSLERIPEIYRDPLVLFYREHQSLQAVAESLDLTEDAVKQRLSRGRKLLHEEVLALVEGALARTRPEKVFTAGVLAGLAGVTATAKAAGTGAAAKGSATAGSKVAGALGLVGSMAGLFIVFLSNYVGYRILLAGAQSEEERARVKSFHGKAGALSLGLFVPTAAVAWLTWGSAGRGFFFGLTTTCWVLVFLPVMFVLGIRSSKDNRQYYAGLLAREHGGAFPKPAWEFCSQIKLLGLPLVHIRIGDRFAVLREPVKAWIAAGHTAVGGLFAFGTAAIAPISVGGFSIGLVSLGGLAVGGVGLGAVAVGIWPIFGGLVIGWQAFNGGIAIAWSAAAGGIALAHDFALGRFAVAVEANNEAARQIIHPNLFFRCAEIINRHWMWLNLLWCVPFLVMSRLARQRRPQRRTPGD